MLTKNPTNYPPTQILHDKHSQSLDSSKKYFDKIKKNRLTTYVREAFQTHELVRLNIKKYRQNLLNFVKNNCSGLKSPPLPRK